MIGSNRLRTNKRGSTIIEFAIVAPIMLLLIMGLGELSYQLYIQAVLSGAMQKAGRDSTIQGNDTHSSAIDDIVKSTVLGVANSAVFRSSRKSYSQFGTIAPEYFFDSNGNGTYDLSSECFIDVNGNGTWDRDPGQNRQGGANDVTVYSMQVDYPRLFPVAMFGWSAINTISATTILKNQPYARQSAYAATKVCP